MSRMRSKRRWMLLFAGLVVLSLLLTACGGSSGIGGGMSEAGGGGPSESGASGAGQPFKVVVAQASDAESFDTPVGWNTAPEWLEENAYDCLMFPSGDGSKMVPVLAESWEWITPTQFRVHLRKGIKFQDGTDFTAADVKYDYDRIKNGTRKQYIVVDQYQFFTSANIVDDYTIDFMLPAPDSLIETKLSQTGCGIPSQDFMEKNGAQALYDHPVGTGPYMLTKWAKGEEVDFTANPNYWQGKPAVDELTFRIIPEASTRLAELLTGGVDITYGLTPQDEQRIKDAGMKAVWAPTDRGWELQPRLKPYEGDDATPELTRKFATEDPKVREAIELAIDKYALRDLVAPVGEAFRSRALGVIPEAAPGLWGKAANLYDPDKAKQILKDAGYKPGEPKLVFDASDTAPGNDIARAIKQMLEAVGFTVDLRLSDTNTFNNNIYFPRKSQDLLLLNLGGDTNPYFSTFEFTKDYAMTPSGYGNTDDDVDRLLQCAYTTTTDEQKRLDCYHQANQIIADKRYIIGLFQNATLWGISNRVKYTPRIDNWIKGYEIQSAGGQ